MTPEKLNPLAHQPPARTDFESHIDAMTPEGRAAYAALPHDEKLRIALKARDSNRSKEA